MSRLEKWDSRWFRVAGQIATWSRDFSRSVGCVIVGPDNDMRAQGYNGFPRSINDRVQARHLRPVKYLWTEHAERNAVYNANLAGQSVRGCTMYVTLHPCAVCARAIVQTGIRRLVCPVADITDPNFGEEFKVAVEMLAEAGVEITNL
jgi:dCMP deaminase